MFPQEQRTPFSLLSLKDQVKSREFFRALETVMGRAQLPAERQD